MATRMRLNLRMIATADFRFGIPYHYEALRKKKMLSDIGDDETILLISGTGRQLAFLFVEVKLETRSGEPMKAISHYRVQLDKHSPWNGLMLTKYAEQAGIELTQKHIKRFEDFIKDPVKAAAQ